MGGGIWEQTNLGGVKVGGDSCGRQATFRMCRRLRFLQLIDDSHPPALGNLFQGCIFLTLWCVHMFFPGVFSSLKALLVRWSIFSWPEVSLFFCILLERFRGGLCVLFLEFLMSFCLIICGLRGVYAFDPGLYCYLQDLCSFWRLAWGCHGDWTLLTLGLFASRWFIFSGFMVG